MPDSGVAAQTEHAFATVLPADAVTLVGQLAKHLEDLADSLALTDVVTRDHDEVASFGCMCGCHVHLLSWADLSMPRRHAATIGATTDLRSVTYGLGGRHDGPSSDAEIRGQVCDP